MRQIQVGDKVEVLEGAKPKRIIGDIGQVVHVQYIPDPHNFYEADVKFSDRFGDKYAVRTTRLRLLNVA
jgi:hypothetical protein